MMTYLEYQDAQKQLGYYGRGKMAGWLELLGISESAHRKYRSGDIPVNPTVQRLIQALLKIQQLEN
jgi:hypothetical protein